MMYDSILTPNVTREKSRTTNESSVKVKELLAAAEKPKSDWTKKQKKARNARNRVAKNSRKKNRS